MSQVLTKKKCELHIYKRSNTQPSIYKCLAPRCHHFINKDFLEGKEALCPKCRCIFTLTKEKLKNKMPVCLLCSKSPKKNIEAVASAAMEDILKKIQEGNL